MSQGEEMSQIAGQMEKLVGSGGFDPFAFIAGKTQLVSLFLAPFSPSLRAAIGSFLADGSGAFAGLPELFTKQGMPALQAQEHVRQLCTAARGMVVCVCASDHAVSTLPLFYFGTWEQAFSDHILSACAQAITDKAALVAMIAQLRTLVNQGTPWPQTIVGRSLAKPRACWLETAGHLVRSLGSSLSSPQQRVRLVDLAHWTAQALASASRLDDPTLVMLIARCHLVAGEESEAMRCLDALLALDASEEVLAEGAVQAAEAAITAGCPGQAVSWLDAFTRRFEERFGTCYDLRLTGFKLRAAASSPADLLLESATALFAANRKCARQDLSRERLWRVTSQHPGALLDTEAAANAVQRSPVFIAKRLEQGTIPSHRTVAAGQEDQIRIPQSALMAWKAVMDAHKLLE